VPARPALVLVVDGLDEALPPGDGLPFGLPGTTVPVCYVAFFFFWRGSGDAGGFERGVVMVPSGAGLVASWPSLPAVAEAAGAAYYSNRTS
jgi:hypothetical protein